METDDEEPPRPRQIVKGQHVVESKVELAKQMRQVMTRAESALWNRLRRNQLAGLHFRRQQIIAGYIADFYCHRAALAVEVDGDTHEAEYDARRDTAFAQRGIRTLRFCNEEVLNNMESVLEKISTVITPDPSPQPPPPEGEGEKRGEDSRSVSYLPSVSPSPSGGGGWGEGSGSARQWDADHMMKSYARQPVQFVRGEGAWLFDADGKRYLDFLSGIAVNAVGHCHPYLTRALQEQAGTLLHVSNYFVTEPSARLARRLMELSDFERVFFCNSGAEANEAAIKIARKFGRTTGSETKTGIITALQSFHGRTLATVTATGQPKYSKDFAPLPQGFSYVPFNDVVSLRQAVNADTAAILLEPIQGESGVWPATVDYLRTARELADQYGALLIFDEVQTGMGRTGKLWAYQRYGVLPDIITSAKGLGGGVPIGACLARGAAAETFQPGDHGSTFGGNPFSATAANAVLDIIADENILENVRRVGAHLTERLAELRERHPETVGGVRGMGLMLGLEMRQPIAKKVAASALANGLVINAPAEDTLRIVPPLTLTEAEADKGVELLELAINNVVRVAEGTYP